MEQRSALNLESGYALARTEQDRVRNKVSLAMMEGCASVKKGRDLLRYSALLAEETLAPSTVRKNFIMNREDAALVLLGEGEEFRIARVTLRERQSARAGVRRGQCAG